MMDAKPAWNIHPTIFAPPIPPNQIYTNRGDSRAMLETLFERIVVDVMFPFFAGAILMSLTLDERFGRLRTALLWAISLASAFAICYISLDHMYGITSTPILGPIHSNMIQTSTLLCVVAFTIVWNISSLLFYKGTPSSKLVVGMIYSAICIIVFVMNDSIYDVIADSQSEPIPVWGCVAIHLVLVAVFFAPLVVHVPDYVRKMISRTDGRMLRYLPIPAAIFILFTLEFGIRIYYKDYTHSNMLGTLIIAAMASICLYLLITRTGGSIRIEGFERDMGAAAAVQASALPKRSDMTGIPGLAVDAATASSKEVAGDFFSIVRMEDRTGIVIADVSDKGLPAAMFMMRAKTLIDDRLSRGMGPAECLGNVNSSLMRDNPTCMFVTAIVAVCDDRGHVTMSSAGHPFPLLRRDGRTSDVEVPRGAVLGLMESSYGEASFELLPGDSLLMFTDGATDCEDRRGKQFGIEQLREAFASIGTNPCEELKKTLMDYSSGTDITDDITLVSLSRT